jgi:pilus assembly protein CpaF
MGATRRFLTAYLAESGNEPSDLALLTLTDLVHIIVVQKIMRDGTRKIIQISEVVGVCPDNPNKANINDLYIFERTGDAEYDDAGNVVSIKGRHRRVGKLSDKIIRKLELEGVNKSQYAFLTEDVKPDEVEEYTGLNIKGYGMSTEEGNG